ncbi:MAG: DNA replication/repair protein RecF [Actinomycetaceae bacterium]|nr:DNA replication/repair protein RecF [Actinomycetaceae bacterium]
MYISDFALDDFRSYRHQVVRFAPGVCVLLGANGQGKTNLVEAIAYLSRFSSHRASADTALVRHSATGEQPGGAVVRAKVHTHGRERVAELEIVRGRANRARLNRTAVAPKELLGLVKTVVFAPEDLSLVRGEPGERRRFLDEVAAQLWPSHQLACSELERIARQRGALLKQLGKDRRSGRRVDTSTLDIFTDSFIELATQVTVGRIRLVQELAETAKQYYYQVSDSERELICSYDFSAVKPLSEVALVDNASLEQAVLNDADSFAQSMRQALERVREDEIWRGVNLVGPHRDDLSLYLDHLPVKGYASHGESWSVALSLKLSSFQLLSEEVTGSVLSQVANGDEDSSVQELPILILDDVFAELDATRRRKLLDVVDKCQQVFITAAVASDIPEGLSGHVYRVHLDAAEGSIIAPVEEVTQGGAEGE